MSLFEKVGGIEAAKKIVEGAPVGEPLILVAVRAEVVRYYSSDLKLWDGKRWVPTTNTKQSLQERYELYWLNDLRFALADTEDRVMAIKVGSKVLVECDNPYEAVVEALDGDQASIRVTSECPAKGSGTLAPLSALLLIVDGQTFDAININLPEIPFFVWQELGSSQPVEDELYLVAYNDIHASASWINEWYFELGDKTYPAGFYEPNGVDPLQNVTHFMRIQRPEVTGND